MEISLIVCTHNRAESLVKALESAAAQELPSSVQWEVVVVDNNSTDRTSEVVQEFCRRYPDRFRYLFEPQQGKSYALNKAIHEARGEVIAFTDDDVTFEPDWLRELTSSLQSGPWVGSGGRTLPERSFARPRWLSLESQFALGPIAIFDLGTEPCELFESPYGNNVAFRREVFDRYGLYRTDLGPRPDSEIRSEDTEFGQRLLSAGERFWYEPSAVIYHAVPAHRRRKSYFLAWWFDKARAEIREITSHDNLAVAGIPLYLFRRLAAWTFRWTFSLNPSRRFSAKTKVWWLAGLIRESYNQAHEAKHFPIDDGP